MVMATELLDYIFDSKKPAFYPEFESWVKGSRRFKAFAATYRAKIRAKLKGVRDEGGLKDLRAELETAVLLLNEAQFALEYEKNAASKQRNPDFTVTFKTHTPFNVEVRRLRSLELEDRDAEARMGKLMTVLSDKIKQMPPSMINLLWLSSEGAISDAALNQAMLTLRQLADRKNEDYFTRRGFESAADFLKQHQRLSGIVLRQTGKNTVWLNAAAKHKTPPDIVKAVQRL